MRHVIVCYRQYGQWSSTHPFTNRAAAEKHVRDYLTTRVIDDGPMKGTITKDKRYVDGITYIDVDLPD